VYYNRSQSSRARCPATSARITRSPHSLKHTNRSRHVHLWVPHRARYEKAECADSRSVLPNSAGFSLAMAKSSKKNFGSHLPKMSFFAFFSEVLLPTAGTGVVQEVATTSHIWNCNLLGIFRSSRRPISPQFLGNRLITQEQNRLVFLGQSSLFRAPWYTGLMHRWLSVSVALAATGGFGLTCRTGSDLSSSSLPTSQRAAIQTCHLSRSSACAVCRCACVWLCVCVCVCSKSAWVEIRFLLGETDTDLK